MLLKYSDVVRVEIKSKQNIFFSLLMAEDSGFVCIFAKSEN